MELYEAIIDRVWLEWISIGNGWFQFRTTTQKYTLPKVKLKNCISKDRFYSTVIFTDTRESSTLSFMDATGQQTKDSTPGPRFSCFRELLLGPIHCQISPLASLKFLMENQAPGELSFGRSLKLPIALLQKIHFMGTPQETSLKNSQFTIL